MKLCLFCRIQTSFSSLALKDSSHKSLMAQDCLARGIVKGSSISLTPECLSTRRQMERTPPVGPATTSSAAGAHQDSPQELQGTENHYIPSEEPPRLLKYQKGLQWMRAISALCKTKPDRGQCNQTWPTTARPGPQLHDSPSHQTFTSLRVTFLPRTVGHSPFRQTIFQRGKPYISIKHTRTHSVPKTALS